MLQLLEQGHQGCILVVQKGNVTDVTNGPKLQTRHQGSNRSLSFLAVRNPEHTNHAELHQMLCARDQEAGREIVNVVAQERQVCDHSVFILVGLVQSNGSINQSDSLL